MFPHDKCTQISFSKLKFTCKSVLLYKDFTARVIISQEPRGKNVAINKASKTGYPQHNWIKRGNTNFTNAYKISVYLEVSNLNVNQT